MQRLLVILTAILAFGCSSEIPGIDCDSDTDCAAGATCHAHACVDTTCDPACGDLHACWNAQCLPAFARPVITAPAVDEVLLGGGKVTVRLDRAVPGTTAPPAELQLVAAAAEKAPIAIRLARVGESLEFEGMLVVGEGTYELKAMLAGLNLESDPVSVEVRSCAGQCGAYEECVAGECHQVFSRLVVVEPGEASLERPVRVRGRIEKAIGTSTREPPPEIEVVATSGGPTEPAKLGRVAGTDSYEGTWPVAADGRYTLVLRSLEAGVESAPATVLVDSEPPLLTIEVKPPTRLPSTDGLVTTEPEPWTGAHRRDEEAEVTISGGDLGSGFDAASVRLSVTGAPAGTIVVTPEPTGVCGVTGGTCFNARIPLHDPQLELKGFHGIFTLRVTAKDLLGRERTETKEIRVTRWKWSKELLSGPIRVSPAIGGRGDVYLGTNNGNAFRVSPAGTSTEVLKTSGPITASPVVHVENGKDMLFVAGKWGSTSSVRCSSGSSGGAVWRVNDAAGVPSGTCVYGVGRNIAASIGLAEMAFFTEPASPTVVGVTAGTAPGLFAVPTGEGLSAYVKGLTADSGEDTGVALIGRKAFFGNNAGSVEGFELTDLGNWTSVAGWHALIGGANRSTAPVITPSQRVIGGAGGVGVGAIYRVASDGQRLTVADTGAPTWQVINVLVDGDSWLVTTADGGNVFVVPEAFSASTPEPRFNLGSTSSAGPAFGADKVLYFSTHAATLQARSVAGELLWEMPLSDASYSAPALDCSRDQSGAPIARPGTLYVGDESGVLYAFITESHGLDFSSPWPKRHRDSQNTADAGRDLSALVCP